jgi:hypothetical protein
MVAILIVFPGLVLAYKGGAPEVDNSNVQINVPAPPGGGANPYAIPAPPSFGAPPPSFDAAPVGDSGALPPAPDFGAPAK